MDKTKDFALALFCFLTFFVVLPTLFSFIEASHLSSAVKGTERFIGLIYGSIAMAAESAFAFVLQLRKFFAPYFGVLAIMLFVFFLMFCMVDYMLVASGFLR